jgi:hypothetical protein
MNVDTLLSKVKTALLIEGEYHNDMLKLYIDEVLNYMRSAGVPDDVLQSERIIGAVARGVTDLWNFGAGNGKLSEYFYQRVIQLVKWGVDSE